MLYIAIAIVLYGVINNSQSWLYTWHNFRLKNSLKNIAEGGQFECNDHSYSVKEVR